MSDSTTSIISKAEPSTAEMLSKGVFRREEIPPCFNTTSLGEVAKNHRDDLIAAAELDEYDAHRINVFQFGSLRRQFSVPNPEIHTLLCDHIAKNWLELKARIDDSELSISKPRLSSESSFHTLMRQSNFEQRARKRVELASRYKYLLITDVEQFYPSIYTHAISWACHGKAHARQRRNRNNRDLFGAKLDELVRRSQGNQTKGIPIGPDSSFLIGELMLSQIDKNLTSTTDVAGFRFVDDYEFGCVSVSDAERLLGRLQDALSEFELSLNGDKTKIVEGPVEMEKPWVHLLRNSTIDECADSFESHTNQYYQLSAFIDGAIETQRKFQKEPVLKYALSRILSFDIHEQNFHLVQGLAFQSAISDPSVLPVVFDILLEVERNEQLEKEVLAQVLNQLIASHSASMHSNVVLWSVWGCHLFEVSIDKTCWESALRVSDGLTAILLMEALKKGLVKGGKNRIQTVLRNRVGEASLRGRDWMLVYESAKNQWFKKRATDGLNEFFEYIREKNVMFFNPQSAGEIRDKYKRGTEWSNYVNDDYQINADSDDFDDDIPF